MIVNEMNVLLITAGDTAQAQRLADLLTDTSGRLWQIAEVALGVAGTPVDQLLTANRVPALLDDPQNGTYDEVWLCDLAPPFEWQWVSPQTETNYGTRTRRWMMQVIDSTNWTNTTEMFIHRVEAQMSNGVGGQPGAFGSWNCGYRAWGGTPKIVHDWDRYTLTNVQGLSGPVGLGNAHSSCCATPEANGWDYDWGDPTTEHPQLTPLSILSTWPQWASYPKFQGAPILTTRETWGRGAITNTYKEGGHRWWLSNLPKNKNFHWWGRTRIQNDWWKYIANTLA